jgi:sugar phosphate permease
VLKRLGELKFTSRWVIVIGVAVVLFGTAGSRFSFGVFMKPLVTEFEWSRGSLSGALAIAGLATGMLRPLAGWLADRFDARYIAASGLVLGGIALLSLSLIEALWQFYLLFLLMGTGFTLASPATLTRLVSERFTKHRGLALSLAGSGSAIGETALVPLTAVALTLSGWRSAYIVLGLIILFAILPVSSMLLSNRMSRRSGGVVEEVVDPADTRKPEEGNGPVCMWAPGEGMALKQAVKTPIFWALTAGFFT